MVRKTAKTVDVVEAPSQNAGRLPTQERSRARVERILEVAMELIAAAGSDALRMSEIAERSGISIGSLYQYFPDKSAVIRRLAERFNAEGQACVAAIMDKVKTHAGLTTALMQATDGYYAMFLAEPVMRDIWSGTQADKALLELDASDNRAHGKMLADTVMRLTPTANRAMIDAEAFLIMHLVAATVRLAITLPRQEAAQAIATFKQTVLAKIRFTTRVKD